MNFLILFIIGLGAGVGGGMLGIGGSLIMIPALTFVYGENQHLYQAAAILCNFFVAAASLIAHYKAQTLNKDILKWLAPLAMLGIVGGVMLSNHSLFRSHNSYLLARLFGGFLVYVAVYNGYRLYQTLPGKAPDSQIRNPVSGRLRSALAGFCGIVSGVAAGLLGIGAGTVSTPMQQFFLRLPLREAMSNSAATIVCIAWLGAIYKNWTLPKHGLQITESFKIAAWVIPGAILGGYLGGHLMHILPKNIVRAAFIVVCLLAAVKLLTVAPR